MAATAKVITLKGNPRNPESAEHIIIFPGGSISVCRTSNNEYWAHIEVHHKKQEPELTDGVRESQHGEVVYSRIDYVYPNNPNVVNMTNIEDIHHIAIRIKTTN
jgi:hypothetical protein